MRTKEADRDNVITVIDTMSHLRSAEAVLDAAITASNIGMAGSALVLLRAAVVRLGKFGVRTDL